MKESLLEAREEIKQLEHTIYVTLKYTRTIDVIKNALNKLIVIFDLIIEALLEKALEEKLITSLPKSPSLKSTLVLKTYPKDKNLLKFITFYGFLRAVLQAKQTKREEYRRHVTLIANLKNKTAEINIDCLETLGKIAKQFFEYVAVFLENKSFAEEEKR